MKLSEMLRVDKGVTAIIGGGGKTTLMYALAEEKPNIGNVRETFFFNQTRVRNSVSSSPVSDFKIGGYTFEVGGKNKGKQQIEELDNAYIVKDEIEYAHGNVVPLWMFGLNY